MDLQLYAKYIQLQSRKEISDHFVFRLGKLHTVFAMLKFIGKYIDNSGLDQAFIEAEIYGNVTIEQINGGKHMKRAFEAFQTLYVTLFQMYIEELIKTNPIIEKDLRSGIIDLCQLMTKQLLTIFMIFKRGCLKCIEIHVYT